MADRVSVSQRCPWGAVGLGGLLDSKNGKHGDMMGIYLLDNLTNNWGKLCCDLTVLYTWTKMGIVRGIIMNYPNSSRRFQVSEIS